MRSPAARLDRLFGHVRHFAAEYIDFDVPAAASALAPAPAGIADEDTVVLTLVAKFARPIEWKSPKNEIAAIRAGKWHPTDVDFLEMAKWMTEDHAFGARTHKIVRISLLGDMLFALAASKPGSVGRVNLITHAMSGAIALRGTVETDGEVWLGGDEDPQNDVSLLDGTTLANLHTANSTDVSKRDQPFGPVKRRTLTFRDALTAFAPSSAQIMLYGCNGGFDQIYLDSLAKTFGIAVNGFAAEIKFLPDYDDGTQPGKGARILSRKLCQYPAGLGETVKGPHRLTPDRHAVLQGVP